MDKLLDGALATADEGRRCDIYKKIQTVLGDDSVMIDFYTMDVRTVYGKDLMKAPKASQIVSPVEPSDFHLVTP